MRHPYLAISVAITVIAVTSAGATERPLALVTLQTVDYDSAVVVFDRLEDTGFHVRHIFPPNQAIGIASSAAVSAMMEDTSISRVLFEPFVSNGAEKAPDADLATRVFMRLPSSSVPSERRMPMSCGTATSASDSDSTNTGGTAVAVAQTIMYNSQYLAGRVAVSVMMMESDGPGEDWTSESEEAAFVEVVRGADWWCDRADENDVSLSWVYELHKRVPTASEPIQGQAVPRGTRVAGFVISWDYGWVTDAIRYLGPTEGWDGLYEYANGLRRRLQADWGYVTFVINAKNDPDHQFSDGVDGYYKPFLKVQENYPFHVVEVPSPLVT